MDKLIEHPCYNSKVITSIGRLHLPVATDCNLQCNYCNRQYDCPNENRPGVTSKILECKDIKEYIEEKIKTNPEIKIIGIAGPGEILADPDIMYNSLSIVKRYFPTYKICIATNGILLADNISLIKDLQVNFITITINSLDPKVNNKIYRSITINNKDYKGDEIGKVILEKHLHALEALKQNHYTFKVNTILMPGINEKNIETISQTIANYNAFIHNIIPLIAVKDSHFEKSNPVSEDMLRRIRKQSSKYINIMSHCQLCRADASGLITKK